jgi:hypothetical protein
VAIEEAQSLVQGVEVVVKVDSGRLEQADGEDLQARMRDFKCRARVDELEVQRLERRRLVCAAGERHSSGVE